MKVAIVGMGTIGSGVLNTIQTNQASIARFIGEALEVTHIYSRTVRNYHHNDLSGIEHVTDRDQLKEIDVDLVIEVMGGMDETYELVKHFLSRGIHVVSANKDMLATYVNDLSAVGNQHQAQLAYEASSAGGIPIINALQYHLNANQITKLMGILNGTTNYILTKMASEGWTYDQALKEAQSIGFAEADPTNDVKGLDAQRKITLLSRLAYKKNIDVNEVAAVGIDRVDIEDIEIAKDNGYTIKLIGLSTYDGDQVTIGVGPSLLNSNHMLAQVDDGMNAVFVEGNVIGQAMFYGPGAGSMETASAVVSEVMNIGRFGYTGNFESDEKAQIASTTTNPKVYIRCAKDPSPLLDEWDVDYELLQAKGSYASLISDLPADQVDQLQAKVELLALYPVQD